MSIFTKITSDEIKSHLLAYNIGELVDFSPLPGGTVNSNYQIITTQGKHVLTLLEVMCISLAKQITQLIHFLNSHNFPTPIIKMTQSGELVTYFHEKPCIIVSFTEGKSPIFPSLKQCFQVGSALAELHLLTAPYLTPIENTMGNLWRETTAQSLLCEFSSQEQTLIKEVIAIQKQTPFLDLPKGIIHFDCFRDNTLFNNDTLNGIIDFNYACYDTFLSDLAICINDWCTEWENSSPELNQTKYDALLQGYTSQRTLTSLEKEHLPNMLKIYALHFWLARTQTKLSSREGIDIFMKDPSEYKAILVHRLAL